MKPGFLVLAYHRVLNNHDPLQPYLPDAFTFEKQMKWLKRFFHVFFLHEALQKLKDNTLSSRSVVITFDDGYSDNYDVAYPILCRLQLKAHFFIATGFLDNGIMWNDLVVEAIRIWQEPTLNFEPLNLHSVPLATFEDKRAAIAKILQGLKYLPLEKRTELAKELGARLPEDFGLMMDTAQVKDLSDQGMGIGAHTVNHPILSNLESRQARKEIAESRDVLEALTHSKVSTFAYPNGRFGKDFTHEHESLLKQLGFKAALSTDWGVVRPWTDVFRIPRFTPWDKNPVKFTLRLLLANSHRDSAPNNMS